MGLQTSGAISIGDIATEFGGSAPHSLSEYYGAAAGVPTSGAISIGDFYGTSSQFTFTITTNQTNANLASLATAAGWDGSSALVATINSGVYISSNSTGTPALTVSGSFPAGVTLVNNGYIVGMGGSGGVGRNGNNTGGSGGYAGGTALSVSSAITINNAGTVAGGGGGGSGGQKGGYGAGGGGGGGRSSAAANSSGGAGGISRYHCSGSYHGSAGGSGTVSSAGGGGARGLGRYLYNERCYDSYGYNGASGGNWGSAGGSGYSSGGAAGAAVSGNSNITWTATGTRLGGIS